MADERQRVAALLPSYDLGAEIGRGGWGVVYSAEHRTLHRRVAIKQLTGGVGDEDARARFRSEARVVASLDHPHGVPLYDFGEHDDVCVFVMELMTGGTLHERTSAGMLPAPTACAVVLGLLSGLQHAHATGVLHRDVKPDNVLFSASDRPKLADFGIAKIVDDASGRRTATGTVLGTPAYMAPEQAGSDAVGPATDLYATGVVLYELLAGRLPFESTGNAMSQLYRHVHEAPRPHRALGIAGALDEVVLRAMAKDPAARHPDAATFAEHLEAAATNTFGAGWLERTSVPVLGAPATSPPTGAPARPVPVPGPAAPPSSGPSPQPDPAPAPELATPTPGRGRRRGAVAFGVGAALLAAAVVTALALGGGGGGADSAERAEPAAQTTTTSEPLDLEGTEARFLEACGLQGVDVELCRCTFDAAARELTESQLRANDDLLRATGDDLTAEFVSLLEHCAEG